MEWRKIDEEEDKEREWRERGMRQKEKERWSGEKQKERSGEREGEVEWRERKRDGVGRERRYGVEGGIKREGEGVGGVLNIKVQIMRNDLKDGNCLLCNLQTHSCTRLFVPCDVHTRTHAGTCTKQHVNYSKLMDR